MILKPIDNLETFCSKAESHIGVWGSKAWLSVYDNRLQLVGIYKDEKQLIGGFYYLKTKKYGFNFIKLPPYTPHCGLFFETDSKNKSSINTHTKEVMLEVCNYIKEQNASLTILAFPTTTNDLQPFIWNQFKVIPNYTYQIDLGKTMEEIKSNFDSKNRNAINKAIKEGVEISENEISKADLYQYFKTTLKTTDANIYNKELEAVFLNFATKHNSFCVTAKHNQKIIGNVFCVYDANICYYLLGGVNKESGIQGVNNLLVQHSIEKAKALQCKVFDFEGSMLQGVEKFFRSFGGNLLPYYTVNKASLPLEMLLKFKKRAIF